MNLELYYDDVTGPATVYYSPVNPEIAEGVGIEFELKEGQTSESRAYEAAEQICKDLERFKGLIYKPLEKNPPNPKPTNKNDLVLKYVDRQQRAIHIVARWGAFNDIRLNDPEKYPDWSKPGAFIGLVGHSKAEAAERATRNGSWGTAWALLASFTTEDSELATEETVQAYLDAFRAEGFSLP